MPTETPAKPPMSFQEIRALIDRLLPVVDDAEKASPTDIRFAAIGTILARLTESTSLVLTQFGASIAEALAAKEQAPQQGSAPPAPATDAVQGESRTAEPPAGAGEAPAPAAVPVSDDDALAFIMEGMTPEDRAAMEPAPTPQPRRPNRPNRRAG